MRSFSWSANVCGQKKWILVPAGFEEMLKPACDGRVPFDVSASMLDSAGVKHFIVIQNAGEVLFVPSGWYHQVYNMEDTISINHNWLNVSNVDICWKYVKDGLKSVEQEIDEYRLSMDNWTEHCQLFLRANIGIDFVDFFNLLYIVSSRRLHFLQQQAKLEGTVTAVSDQAVSREPSVDDPIADSELASKIQASKVVISYGDIGCRNHAIYDLFCVEKIVKEIVDTDIGGILQLNAGRLLYCPNDLLTEMQTVLKSCL
jgi:hypothetical protein